MNTVSMSFGTLFPVLMYFLLGLLGAETQNCPPLPGYTLIPDLAMRHFEAGLYIPQVPVELDLQEMAKACNKTAACAGFDTLKPSTVDSEGNTLAAKSRYLRAYITTTNLMLKTSVIEGSTGSGCQGTFVKTNDTIIELTGQKVNGSLCVVEELENYIFYGGMTFGSADDFFPYPSKEQMLDTSSFFPTRFTQFLPNPEPDKFPNFREEVPGAALARTCEKTAPTCWAGTSRCIPCLAFSTKHGILVDIPPRALWYKFTDSPCHGLYVRKDETIGRMSRSVRALLEKDKTKWPSLFGEDLDTYPQNALITRELPIASAETIPGAPFLVTWQIAVNITHTATFGDNQTELAGIGNGWDVSINCSETGSYSGLPPLVGPRFQLRSFTVRGCDMPGVLPAKWVPPARATDYSQNRISGPLPTIPVDAYTRSLACLNLSNNYLKGHIPDGADGWLVKTYDGAGPNLFDISGNKMKPLSHLALERICLNDSSRLYFSRAEAEKTFRELDLLYKEASPYTPACLYWGGTSRFRLGIAADNAVERNRGTLYAIGRGAYGAREFPRNLCTNPGGLVAVAVMFCVAAAVILAVVLYRLITAIISKRRGLDKPDTCTPWETRGERPNFYALLALMLAWANIVTDAMVLDVFLKAKRWGSFGPGLATMVATALIFGLTLTEHLSRGQTERLWRTTRCMLPLSWIPVGVITLLTMFPRCLNRHWGPLWSKRIDPGRFVRMLGLVILPENCCMLGLQSYALGQGNALGNTKLLDTPLMVIAILINLMSLVRTVSELILEPRGSFQSLGHSLVDDGFHHGLPEEHVSNAKEYPMTDLAKLRPTSPLYQANGASSMGNGMSVYAEGPQPSPRGKKPFEDA